MEPIAEYHYLKFPPYVREEMMRLDSNYTLIELMQLHGALPEIVLYDFQMSRKELDNFYRREE